METASILIKSPITYNSPSNVSPASLSSLIRASRRSAASFFKRSFSSCSHFSNFSFCTFKSASVFDKTPTMLSLAWSSMPFLIALYGSFRFLRSFSVVVLILTSSEYAAFTASYPFLSSLSLTSSFAYFFASFFASSELFVKCTISAFTNALINRSLFSGLNKITSPAFPFDGMIEVCTISNVASSITSASIALFLSVILIKI